MCTVNWRASADLVVENDILEFWRSHIRSTGDLASLGITMTAHKTMERECDLRAALVRVQCSGHAIIALWRPNFVMQVSPRSIYGYIM